MWKVGNFLVWDHWCKILDDELENGLKLNSVLTSCHIQLSPFSCINLNLAAQTRRATNANILSNYYKHRCIAKTWIIVLDCLNVKRIQEGEYNRNGSLKPYITENDFQCNWFENTLLPFFSSWKHNILQQPGNFTSSAREKMFISRQTQESIKIACNSVIEDTKIY